MLTKYVKKGAYNTFFYGLSSVVSRAISFAFLPYFLAKLSLTEFGIWDFYQMFFSIGTLVLSSTAATGMIRFFLLHKNDEKKQQQALGNSLLFILGITLLFQGGMLITLITFYFNHPNFNYLLITSFNISFFALFSMVLAYFRVKEYLWSYFFVFCGQSFLAIIMTLFAVYKGFGIEGFFYANGISFMFFFPGFIYLLNKYNTFSLSLFKDQITYSVPLLLYGVLYSFFFSIDRFFIKEYAGYESLGTYALLWRFGSIFQFFSIALIDASPVVLFNAQKEKNGDYLIAQLINYFCLAISTVCLCLIIGARLGIGLLFPIKYHFLISYLPLFFLPIIIIELARIMQIGIILSTKTIFGPLLTSIGLSIQASLLYLFKSFSLQGILIANSVSFAALSIIAYFTSCSIYSSTIFNRKKIITIFALFVAHMAFLQLLFFYPISWCWLSLPLFSWISCLWFFAIEHKEKRWLKQKTIQTLDWIIKHRKKDIKPIIQLKTVLYLKSDIYYHCITSGGSFTHTLGVLQGLKNLNCTILCAAASMHDQLKKINTHHFQKLHAWPLFFFLRWKLGFLRWHADCLISTISFAFQTRKLFKKYKVDALYQRYSWLNATGIVLSFAKKVPLILEYNGSEVWIAKKAKQRSFGFLWLAEIIEKFNLRYADYIVVVSQAQKDELLEQNVDDKKILVNPNGVDHETFNPALLDNDRNNIRTKLGIEKKFLFGFIGSFSFWHGIDTLAAMIPEIVKKNSQIHFILIGDGPLKNSLVQKIKPVIDHVTLTGMLEQSAAKHYLAACDAFLCPTQPLSDGSRFFGSPTKLFEYMSMAKPIIASDLEQISKIIHPALYSDDLEKKTEITDQVGILVQPEQVNDFIKAAFWLTLLEKNKQKQLGTNARNKVGAQYTWNNHVKNIRSFLKHNS